MIALDLLWWVGWIYFAAWAALPLALVRVIGPVPGVVAWALIAPWSALAGMAALHRALPPGEEGTFRMFADRGSVRWAVKGWAPSVYLGVFQPVFFLSPLFQQAVLRAFGARMGAGAKVTTRTSVREPHLLDLGRDSLVGEYTHLVTSYQPRPRILVVGRIRIGDDAFVGAYCVLGAGCSVGARSIVEYRASIGPRATIGEDTFIGADTAVRVGARIGNGVRTGKSCLIGMGAVVPDGTRLPDGATWPATTAPNAPGGAA